MKKIILCSLFLILAIPSLTRADALTDRLKGRILLQVEDAGRAWYVEPSTGQRAFLGKPVDAFRVMRGMGLGITNKDLERIAKEGENDKDLAFAKKMSGKILLQVEGKGEAWYVYPQDFKRYYLGRPADAFAVMRKLGLGIRNADLAKISVHGQYNLYDVTEVVDGDTVKVNVDGTIKTLRLIGINTPETVDPRKPVECFGKEASDKAKELLLGKKVKLESDPTQGELDKYNRLLRYVWLEDGTSYNKKMIADGYAYEYTYNTPYKYQTEFMAAETDAKNNKKGLWADGACSQPSSDSSVSGQPAQTTPAVTSPSSHIFYTSSYQTAKLYYCDTDEGWKELKKEYLKSYASESELLKDYPSRALHEPCK